MPWLPLCAVKLLFPEVPVIKPTINRNILVHRSNAIDKLQPEAGYIVYVHGDDCINIAGFDANGQHFSATSVYLHQGDAPLPAWCLPNEEGHHGTWAEWMPYQIGQAAKTAELEARLAAPLSDRDAEAPVGSGG